MSERENRLRKGLRIGLPVVVAGAALVYLGANQDPETSSRIPPVPSQGIVGAADFLPAEASEWAISRYEYLRKFLACEGGSDWCWRDEAEDLKGKELVLVIFGAAPRMGRVTSPNGLKVRYVPSTSEKLGEGYIAPQREWKQRGEKVSWDFEVEVMDERSGRKEARWAVDFSPVTPQGPEVPKFVALEIDGKKLVDTLEGEAGVARPRPKIEILASRSGRQLPRSQPPQRVTRSGYSTVVPGPKSSFWAARTSW